MKDVKPQMLTVQIEKPRLSLGRTERVPGKIEISLYLDEDLVKALKIRAVKERKRYSAVANEILKAALLS